MKIDKKKKKQFPKMSKEKSMLLSVIRFQL